MARFHGPQGFGTLYVKVFDPTGLQVRQSGTGFTALSGVADSAYGTGLFTATETVSSNGTGSGEYTWSPAAFPAGEYPCKVYASATATPASYPKAAFYLEWDGANEIPDSILSTVLDILQADQYIDTRTVPWQRVLIKRGTGDLTSGTILVQETLYDSSGVAVSGASQDIGKAIT